MSATPRLLATAGAASLCVAGLIPMASAFAAPSHPAKGATNSTASHKTRLSRSALKFSHEVIVDEQRSGFEPDILVDGKDRMYTSVPNGSSEGTSFVWISTDHGKSFHLVPGSVLQGKPNTCPQGGGDTELQLDKANNLFLSDLQNLTNLSNSVTKDQGKTWQTTCVGATNTPVDRMWYAVQGTLGQPNFAIYEEYDAVESGVSESSGFGSNQLVEEVSSDGVHFVPVTNPNFTDNCLGGGAYNCVSDDEGISGNQLVTPKGEVVIGHSGADGNKVFVSHSVPKLSRTGGTITSASATWKNVVVNRGICPDKAGKAPGVCGATQFVTVAQDSAGNLYASFSSRKTDAQGDQTGPYNVYVVSSRDGGNHWSRPVRVSRGGSNSFSWVTAGSKGRAAMAWYHSNIAKGKPNYQGDGDKYGYTFDSLANAEFNVQVGESINALAKHPKYKVSTVSEHPIKYGPICTLGLDCTVSGGDRSLGDFLEVSHDARGALAVSYVDDTSNTYTTGATGFAENGPPVVSRQIHGVALIKGKGNRRGSISGAGKGPAAPMNKVTDPKGDDYYSANGALTPAGKALDLRGDRVRLSRDHKSLIFTMKASSLKSLAVPTSAGGTNGVWITRFTTYNPHTLGNGHIYYVGMESSGGAKPTFFDGDTAPPSEQVQLSMVFTAGHAIKGNYKAKRGVISLRAPLKDFKGIKRNAKLYSVTGFTGTTATPLPTSTSGTTGVSNQINQTDATAPFDFVVHRSAPRHHRAHSAAIGWSPVDSLLTGLFGAAGLGLLAAAALIAVRRRRVTGEALAH